MLQTHDSDSSPHKQSLFEHLFLHYGVGGQVFAPLVRYKHWNTICWVVIGLGIVGWIIALWYLRGYTDCGFFDPSCVSVE